jgi:fructose-1,6-bisphosphatase I
MPSVKIGIPLSRHILEQQSLHPDATGDFSHILQQLLLAGKIISREVSKAGLAEILGLTGKDNVHGEAVKKLDMYANDVLIKVLDHCGQLCVMASEENEEAIHIPDRFVTGKYAIAFDPLDGSSNIDVNINIGTIFSIHRKISPGDRGDESDLLQPGSKQVAAGYILYGPSTMLVYTTGDGTHGFTLDPSIGEFLLSHPHIKIPVRGKYYSVNEGNTSYWSEPTRRYVNYLKSSENKNGKPYSTRYIGSLVADFHRTLLYGGVFLYPADCRDPKKPNPKLRLLYEAAPLAFLLEQAGGRAITGTEDIMDVVPTGLHDRVPLILGSPEDVAEAETFYRKLRIPA